jgi:tetratricopeptide (TPR) repeat protein
MVTAPWGTWGALAAVLLSAACAASGGVEANSAVSPSVSAGTSANASASPRAAPTAERTADAQALLDGDYDGTIKLANRALQSKPRDPWPLYNRGCALIGLGRTNEAIASFKEAEARFGADEYGRVVSTYGRARAYAAVHRCEEAERAYREFAEMVGTVNEAAAEMATTYAKDCVAMAASPRGQTPSAVGPSSPKP